MLEAERNARMAAQRATRIKDEFLATLSHELRTPLSAILGWTQVLKRSADSLELDDLQRGIEVIDRNARVQVQLIDDLLDLSRIMAGKVRLDLQQVSMLEVVKGAVESAQPGATGKEIRLRAVLDPHPLTVHADASRLQQVIWNLLSNAIKFTPKGGRVEVLLRRLDSRLELSVSDSGIGIPASFLPLVFDRFSQKDSSTTRRFGGLGLGLAISKQLVELHGGSIRATSKGEGLGATFFVDLPLSARQLESERAGPDSPSAQASPAQNASRSTLAGLQVFVVDDDPDTRELLQRVLEDQAATVTGLSSAQEALDQLKKVRPSLIISDIGMPQMDGHQFMRTLRAGEANGERIPALALTAFARPDDRERSLLAGYQAHLTKPFEVAQLLLVVTELAGRSGDLDPAA